MVVANLNERAGKNREKERRGGSRAVCLRFPVRSPLDRAEIWTAASRHVTLHSERLD